MNPLLDAALGYAARGWPVFPCQPSGKEPATAHGFKDATTDPARIRTWWETMPTANIGIATGHPGPDVIDFDTDDETGLTALAALTQAGLLEDRGLLVRTRSGGWHAYFNGTTQRNGSLKRRGAAVDFRAQGGYVIAAPSQVSADTKPGGHYQIVSDGSGQPASLDWRIATDLIVPPPPPAEFQQPARDATEPATGRPGDRWAASTSWPAILTPHGWRMVRQLGTVRYWCRPGKTGRGISASTRDDGGLYVFSTSTEFEPEVPYTKFGALAVLEHGGDHAAAAAHLRREGYGEPAATLAAIPPQPQQATSSSQDAPDDWWTPIAARHQLIDWPQLWDDTPEDEDWIVEPVIAAGRSIALYSPPKTGKSLLVLELAAAVATGSPVLGQPASHPRRVLYVDLENSRRDLRDRLDALSYKPADLGNLAYLSFPSLPALDSARGGLEILGLAIAHEVELVIIDTVSRVISGGENDADTFAALYRHALAPLKGRGIAVIRIDHSGKDVSKGQRGSSAKNADVDAVWELTAAGPILTLRCEMSRTAIEVQAISLRRETGPLRHVPTSPTAAVTDRVQELIAKLDELGVPRGRGRPTCQQALHEAGVRVDSNVLEEVIRVRKMTIKLPESGSGSSRLQAGTENLPGDHQAGLNGTHETADQTCLKDHQAGAGRLFQGVPVIPACNGGPPYGGPVQAGTDAAGRQGWCTGCGEASHPGRACFTAGAAV